MEVSSKWAVFIYVFKQENFYDLVIIFPSVRSLQKLQKGYRRLTEVTEGFCKPYRRLTQALGPPTADLGLENRSVLSEIVHAFGK